MENLGPLLEGKNELVTVTAGKTEMMNILLL